MRALTGAAGRARIRAGMTVAEARARCAALQILPWDEAVIAEEVRRATAAFLAASPQVTPVAGAPGLWWIGAAGLESLGGERTLAQTLVRIGQSWHGGVRVAIADSCAAARAATWDRQARTTLIVPRGGDPGYLATVPLGLLPMDDDLRETLAALGIRTAGALGAFSAEDIERRWGAAGLAAWRLARGDDQRRPVLARTDVARAASAELTPAVSGMEPVLFLVRAALDRLVRDLVTDGRAAATIAITLTLDDARGHLPDHAPAHTITREVRLARPLARVAPLLERCRALLDRWTLPAPVCAVTVAIVATAPLVGEQGDLLEPAWRDPAAADAAFARLRAELGPNAIVFPEARDEHRPERAGAWREVAEEATGHRPQAAGHRPLGNTADSGAASPVADPPALRQLEPPEAVEVECEDERPRVLWWRGRRLRIAYSLGPERLAGDWWREGYGRDYWRCEEEDGTDLVLFRDKQTREEKWYVQGWYD